MSDADYQSELGALIRTLVGAGLDVTTVTTKPLYFVVNAKRFDEFGIPSNYLFGYCTKGPLSPADCHTLTKLANENRAALIIAGEAAEKPASAVLIGKEDLLGKLGGPVLSLLPLEPDYTAQLIVLARNNPVPGLVGKPDDLFELYVHAGLQFLLRGRVLRYGQERRFEALPDGVVVNSSAPLMLYDCKAAGPMYEITKNTIRQFADYVQDFRKRYEKYLGHLHAFLLVSSAFQDIECLRNRSNEMYADCEVPLVCMTAKTLAECVRLFADHPLHRMAIDWRQVFVQPMVEIAAVRKQLNARIKDGVIR